MTGNPSGWLIFGANLKCPPQPISAQPVMALSLLLRLLLCCGLATTSAAPPRTVTYDSRSLLLSGQRTFIHSGSLHYQRFLPADWPRALGLAKELGLNTVQTYVQWDEHEPVQGQVSFSGRNNLTQFVGLAAGLGLNVIVRIGPYTCGEHTFGGIPQWMRSSGAQCFRCSDPIWEGFTARVLASVVQQLQAAGQLYPQGGPVIALQVENEYNGADLPCA